MIEKSELNKLLKKSGFADSAESLILADETVDDLELDGLAILQKKNGYKFSTDSVLLSDFAKTKRGDTLVDLCSGSGVVAILTAHKNQTKRTIMVEIQSEISDMARRTLLLNGITNIEPLNADLSDAHKILGHEMADVITVNPPYFNSGARSKDSQISMSTHELSTGLDQLALECFKLLKFKGKLFMVHSAERLVEVLCSLKKYGLETKRLRVVYPKASKQPNLILLEAVKGASVGVKIESPLILNKEDGTESEELKKIYNRNK